MELICQNVLIDSVNLSSSLPHLQVVKTSEVISILRAENGLLTLSNLSLLMMESPKEDTDIIFFQKNLISLELVLLL